MPKPLTHREGYILERLTWRVPAKVRLLKGLYRQLIEKGIPLDDPKMVEIRKVLEAFR